MNDDQRQYPSHPCIVANLVVGGRRCRWQRSKSEEGGVSVELGQRCLLLTHLALATSYHKTKLAEVVDAEILCVVR